MKGPIFRFFHRKSDHSLIPVNLVLPSQSHSIEAAFVTSKEDNLKADALVTNSPNTSIGVKTADCMPIFLYDENSQIIAVAHAGWKGLINGIIENTIRTMIENGATIPNIKVVIGPSIGPCCYPIFGNRKNEFEKHFPHHVDRIFVERKEKAYLNLQECAKIISLEQGIEKVNIDLTHFECTSCNPEKFDSYFRDGICGRQLLSVISLSDKQNT